MMKCQGGQDHEPQYLAAAPSILCWTPEHYHLLMVTFPSITITLLGVPLLYAHVLFWRIPREGFRSPKLWNNYGFVYSRFEERYHYWEVPYQLEAPSLTNSTPTL
jgi:hypothetical protein